MSLRHTECVLRLQLRLRLQLPLPLRLLLLRHALRLLRWRVLWLLRHVL